MNDLNNNNILAFFERHGYRKADEKSRICNDVLRALPSWFGIESSIVDYVNDVQTMPFYAAFDSDQPVGFTDKGTDHLPFSKSINSDSYIANSAFQAVVRRSVLHTAFAGLVDGIHSTGCRKVK